MVALAIHEHKCFLFRPFPVPVRSSICVCEVAPECVEWKERVSGVHSLFFLGRRGKLFSLFYCLWSGGEPNFRRRESCSFLLFSLRFCPLVFLPPVFLFLVFLRGQTQVNVLLTYNFPYLLSSPVACGEGKMFQMLPLLFALNLHTQHTHILLAYTCAQASRAVALHSCAFIRRSRAENNNK